MSSQSVKPSQKNLMSAASKITKVVNDFFLPLTEGYFPTYTPLTPTPDAEETLILERIWETFPESMRTREQFVAKMGEMYDNNRQPTEPHTGEKRKREVVEDILTHSYL